MFEKVLLVVLLTNRTLQGGERKKEKNSLPGLQEMVMPSEWGFLF